MAGLNLGELCATCTLQGVPRHYTMQFKCKECEEHMPVGSCFAGGGCEDLMISLRAF
jgi:hypothetical protein